MKSRILLAVLFCVLIATGACQRTGSGQARPESGETPPVTVPANPPEPWASNPPHEWPQIVLTNHGEFDGHTALHGASAFLIRTRDGLTLAATAKHLLGENGGVRPEIPLARLDRAVRSWRMHPRTLPDRFVEIAKLGASGPDDPNFDWLILTVKDSSGDLPAAPLRLRPEPVQVGERVYLVGCPYAEENCKQNVYSGQVTNRAHGDRFRFDINPPVELRGFSGAPIIDGRGHVVGVMTVWFNPRKSGDKHLEAGGEDATSVYRYVEK